MCPVVGSDGVLGLTARVVAAQPGQHLRWTDPAAPIILLLPLLPPASPVGPTNHCTLLLASMLLP
jgi:hypothetical protein